MAKEKPMKTRNGKLNRAVSELPASCGPARKVLAELHGTTDAELDHWLGTRRGRRAVSALRRRLATLRELDVARAAAVGAERLVSSLAGDVKELRPAELRAAVAVVQLARAAGRPSKGEAAAKTRRVASNDDDGDGAVAVDPMLLAALEDARRVEG